MQKYKKLLDLIPGIALTIYAIISSIKMSHLQYELQWQHYLGYILLIATAFCFYKKHQAGVLFTGFTILAALFTLVSFSVGVITSSFYWTPFGIQIPLFWGNPFLLPFIIIHFILSGRYYVGILTKKYWQTFLSTNEQAKPE